MKILTTWLRSYLPGLTATDAQLAEDLTLRGIAVEGVFDLTPQHGADAGSLFEMDITTNRVDAMNHYGIAREAAVIYGIPLAPLDLTLPAELPGEAFPVRVEAPELCGRFTARVLRGITIAPSTGEVARRFRLLEQKQISNAVDATNYVTQAIGQPTHAFDLDTLQGGIVVRRAHKGERLRTLDGVERTLDPDDLVIADEEKALGIAGVMGGWDSMITPATRNVLVEAAWFDPASVRRSSKRHGLHTDASHRFERGADFNAAPAASAMVSRILLQSGGAIHGPFVDIQQPAALARTASRAAVSLQMREVRRILGPTDDPMGIPAAAVHTILSGLGCEVTAAPSSLEQPGAPASEGTHTAPMLVPVPAVLSRFEPTLPLGDEPADTALPTQASELPGHGDRPHAAAKSASDPAVFVPSPNPARALEVADPAHETPAVRSTPEQFQVERFQVTLPSWRLDLEREIDLLEEIARVHGYNRFLNTLPAFTGSVRELPSAPAFRVLRKTLLGAGWSEAISSTFVSAQDAGVFAAQPNTAVPMENPLSEEAGMLRPSLVPGMLTMLAHNLHRGVEHAALFELGTVFTGTAATATDQPTDRVAERPSLAFGAIGTLHNQPVDFYTAKGIVEALAAQFTTRLVYFDRFPPESGLLPAWLHPGRSARLVVDGSTIGFFGQLHPDEAAARKLKHTVVLGELRIDRLLQLGLRHPMPRELSRFQPVRRDFSFLLPATVEYGAIAEAVRALRIPDLQSFEPAEIREQPAAAPGAPAEYSLLLRTTFQSAERTLRDEDLQRGSQQVQDAIASVGGRLRSLQPAG
ncbi:phenylalanine--tRNA ligase subunit beta [Acidipila sp. EB88]|uniref:phenylalanine--tRNA ligase subunit beta n=1 Tax=Acidipila sp. EB88 TaxID=2305226 RepID=UPI000F5E7693|nr:phenylalanine--tRNA ligase subunit beta [Acidipila sp. EB88]RRA48437.1 phenylalanine--tRNA ligase subunit beta [Acidipila sp. EB88]